MTTAATWTEGTRRGFARICSSLPLQGRRCRRSREDTKIRADPAHAPAPTRAEPANPPASFPVPPPDVPAPRPTPCTPPRHALHPSQLCWHRVPDTSTWGWALLTSPPNCASIQLPQPSPIPHPQLGQNLHPGTVVVTKADRHPENPPRSHRGKKNHNPNPPSSLLLLELSRARHRR